MNIDQFFYEIDDCLKCYISLHAFEIELDILKKQHPNNATYRVLKNWLDLSKWAESYNTPITLREQLGVENLIFEYNLIDEADELSNEQKKRIRDFYEEYTHIAGLAVSARAANALVRLAPQSAGKRRKTRMRKNRKYCKTRKNRN